MDNYRNLDRMIGEGIFFVLSLIPTWFLSLFYSSVVMAFIIIFGKLAYDKDPRTTLHLPRYLCWPLTFGCLYGVGILYFYLSYLSPFLYNQPLVPVIIGVAVLCYLMHLGDVIAEPQIALENEQKKNAEIAYARNLVISGYEAQLNAPKLLKLDMNTITEDELRPLCKDNNINELDTNIAIAIYINKMSPKDIYREFNLSTHENAKKKVTRIRNKIKQILENQ